VIQDLIIYGMASGAACMNIVFRAYTDLQLQDLERFVSFTSLLVLEASC